MLVPTATRRITVRSTRFDGSLRDEFEADFLGTAGTTLIVRTHVGTPIRVPNGVIAEVACATQILFTDRWYNVNHFHDIVAPYSNLWYANIAMPARFDGDSIEWIDLDLDVMCDVDRGVLLKDVELFEDRVASGYYPPDIVANVYAARDEVLALADRGAFPFDRHTHIG